MVLADIRARIQAESDARFGETIEKLLVLLRQHHGHQSCRKECHCEYCQFINGEYVANKLFLHKLKRRLNWYEYHNLTFDKACMHMTLEMAVARQKWLCQDLKRHKKELHKNVL
jgi:hypothetical protein